MVYRGREGIDTILEFVSGPLIVPFFVLQFGIGSLVPLLLLTYVIARGMTGRGMVAAVTTSAVLVLLAVLMMRWNVVIGGQEISKTGKGLLQYSPVVFHREGLVAAASALVAPFIVLAVMTRLFPPWHDARTPEAQPI